MFMSRVSLNSRRRGAMKLLANRHAMHAAVMSSFSPATPLESERGRVLWRIDRNGHDVDLLIVSPTAPCLAHIIEQAGWSTENAWATRRYDEFLDAIASDTQYAFRITANPTHRLTEGGRKQIVGHRTVEHQRRWLVEKSTSHGFAVLPATIEGTGDLTPPLALTLSDRQTSTFRRNGSKVTLVTARFDGALIVTNDDAFRRTLGHGIGRGKGYGCGLLTVLPMTSHE